MKKLIATAALLTVTALFLAGCAAVASTVAAPSSSVATIVSLSPSAAATETALPSAGYRKITPKDAKPLIGAKGVVLLDVRTQEEYDEKHIGGAVLLPYDEITPESAPLPTDKSATIIVYCRTGRRSAIAAQTLVGMGYTSVYDLGGILSWPYDTVAGG